MIIGKCGRDLNLRYMPAGGQAVASSLIATGESFTDKNGAKQERVDWHQVVV
jgi:single-strand DNA-binding protein